MIEKNWKEIIKPSKLEVRNEKNPEYTSSIIAEPLERGYGAVSYTHLTLPTNACV